ncbi:coiled-coil domain-containing protein 42 homolog [Pagrus major]|uniref:coiled-coil domain-containing protein 42 homolog n=1 Tax=Pagrus major TaxID=143350 RepID=UPI003CC85E8B
MNSWTVREEQGTTSLPAAARCATPSPRDRTAVFFELQEKQHELLELDAQTEERRQVLETLHQRKEELDTKYKEVEEFHSSYDLFLKDEENDRLVEKAERQRKEGLQKEAEIKRLKEEYAGLMERKQELQRRVQSHGVYQDFMERVVKMTTFSDVQRLAGHLESLLHFRGKLCQRESEAQEQADQQRKALQTLEDQHHLLQLHKNNQLSQLYKKLEKMCSEALTWERKWNHIQETAAMKTLLLGKVKIATLNLYEMIDDEVKGEEGVDVNDTETQLDKVRMFIQDNEEILKQHQTPSQAKPSLTHNEGQKRKEQKRDKTRKQIFTHK